MLRNRLLVRLDSDTKRIGSIWLPDKDSIKYCGRCGLVAEALDGPCVPEDIYELDDQERRLLHRGQDFSHQIEYVTQDIVTDGLRPATVLYSSSPDFAPGDRVIVSASAGESIIDDEPNSAFRVIRDEVVQATVEE